MIDPNIEQLAADLLVKHDVLVAPVPIELVAGKEGIAIARNHFSGTESGFALRQGEMQIIGVNTATSPRRQRFTIAHEIGHLKLHSSKSLIVDHSVFVAKRDEISSLGSDVQEVQANGFAAAVLMPQNLVLSNLKGLLEEGNFQSRDELIAKMARAFDVSNEAMGYRLINLSIITA